MFMACNDRISTWVRKWFFADRSANIWVKKQEFYPYQQQYGYEMALSFTCFFHMVKNSRFLHMINNRLICNG